MKIGITERGDAGIDLGWVCRLNGVDGAVLITKNITKPFKSIVLSETKPLIVHCTCTGYGQTPLEPNVPAPTVQLDNLKDLIDKGFPAERCVLRIDPIFPTEGGMQRLCNVIDYFLSLQTGVTRVRISLVDEYPHVRERYKKHNIEPVYHGGFAPSKEQMRMVADVLNNYDLTYETCAEDAFSLMLKNGIVRGCVGETDLQLMGLPEYESPFNNPQNRKGCHCLDCKSELLGIKGRCPNGCLYCYWKG